MTSDEFHTSAAYDLLICDIDGCLSPESSAAMDLESLKWIGDYNKQAFNKKDRPAITLCSGRPIGFVEAMCRLLQNERIPAVST